MFLKNHILVILLCLSAFSSVYADENVVIGERINLYSNHLKEDRPLLIYLPNGYSSSIDKRYPVLYTLDGEEHFKRVVGTVDWLKYSARVIPEHIIVAIPNTGSNRWRDLAPRRNGSGGVDKFLDFLSSELIPYIDKQYRTHPFRILSGHSLAGLFTIHTLMQRSELFQGYIAISPYFALEQGALVRQAANHFKQQDSLPAFLYASLGDEDNLRPAFDQFIGILKNDAPKDLDWNSHIFPNETHMTTPGVTLHSGLKALYADLQISGDSELFQEGINSVKAHFKELSEKKYGYEVSTEMVVSELGVAALRKRDIERAIHIMQINAVDYPDSWQAHGNLSVALEAGKQLEAALDVTKLAHKLAEKQNHSAKDYLKMRMQQLEEKVARVSTKNK